jgi:hypothetical protein
MIRLSSLIERFEAPFLTQYQASILPSRRQAVAPMKHCRTAHSPLMQARCTDSDHQVLVPHSCGHRSCPHCQHHECQQWLERQLKKQLPAEYFLSTFTLPVELRSLARHQQRTLYACLIRSSWACMKTFTQNEPHLTGSAGAITVLHTHSRRLTYHPHMHVVMPAAAVDTKRRLWRTKTAKGKGGYLFNHKALAEVFRAKMLAAITSEGLALPEHYPHTWVVDCKSVGTGAKALVYLGRYLYRGVIREQDILACENGQVTFRYQNAKTKRTELRTVSGPRFLWLILQHVLPKGFRRARNFGFLHPNSKRLIALLHYLLRFDPNRLLASLKQRPRLSCQCCGGAMKIVRTRIVPALCAVSLVPIDVRAGVSVM